MAKANTEVATVNQSMSYDLARPASLINLATDLKKFIVEQKLSSNIQGKEYANVEAWQFAGLSLGIIPIISKVENLSPVEGEIKYRAEVELFHNDRKVGFGVALCSNKEPTKKFYAEYAIASMSQTRAVGKAYRLMLGFLMKAAGFEATPMEEMQEAVVVEEKPKKSEPSTSKKQSAEIDVAVANYVDPPAKTETIPATNNQKTQILLLLNVSCIKKEEKEKMVAKLHSFDQGRADAAIAKLKKTINERGLETGEVATGKQIELIEKLLKSHVFIDEERNQITEQIQTGKWLKTEAMACIEWLQDEIKVRKENEKEAA